MSEVKIGKEQFDALFGLMEKVTKKGKVSRSSFFKVVQRKYNDEAAPTREKAALDLKILHTQMQEKVRKKIPKSYLEYLKLAKKYDKRISRPKGSLEASNLGGPVVRWVLSFDYHMADLPVKVSKKDEIEYLRLKKASEQRYVRDFTPQFLARELKNSDAGMQLLALVDDVIDLVNAKGY